MSKISKYYGPAAADEQEVNRLLALTASGREQDWEIELADPEKLDKMMYLLESHQLTEHVKTALCLLMLSSFDAELDSGEVNADRVHRAADLLRQDAYVLERMRFYWLDLQRANHMDAMKELLSSNRGNQEQ
ncbi:MAG: hypothetical protein WEB53_14330 [Akkermansiaceae bacterium]